MDKQNKKDAQTRTFSIKRFIFYRREINTRVTNTPSMTGGRKRYTQSTDQFVSRKSQNDNCPSDRNNGIRCVYLCSYEIYRTCSFDQVFFWVCLSLGKRLIRIQWYPKIFPIGGSSLQCFVLFARYFTHHIILSEWIMYLCYIIKQRLQQKWKQKLQLKWNNTWKCL